MPQAHILIVEDDADIATLLARFLGERGHAASIAADGPAMEAALATTAFDIVLLDIMLPGESGLVLCQRLRSTRSVGIIMVTALTEPGDRVAGLDVGADDYVCKPFDLDELEARIRAVLRRRDTGAGPATDMTLRFADHQFQPQRRILRTPAGISHFAHRCRGRPPARVLPTPAGGVVARTVDRVDARRGGRRAGPGHRPSRQSASP